MDAYTFQDIFDIDFLQKLIDSLSVVLQVGISIRGPHGERITRDSDHCRSSGQHSGGAGAPGGGCAGG